MRRESALFETPGPLLFLPLLLIQGGGMDLSRVGEKLLSSVRSARSLGLLPSPSDRPEVPARAAAAAAVARALAGLPPHQRISLPSSSDELVSIYGSYPQDQTIEELEEDFYEEVFDPVRYILDNIPSEEDDVAYLDKQSTLRLAQLDKIAERLSRHVMEHHEEMVKGMQLVMELEQDLKVANVICMNGRRHIASSKYEVSRDLVVNTKSKKKRALLDMLPILTELRHALDMQMELESLVESGNYYRAFQLLPEYLQVLDNYSELSAVQEMGRGVEAWLVRTIQKLDSHLLGVCQTFKEESYITAVDAYALMGDIGGMAEKIQSFFLQEVLSQTHLVLKDMVQEETGNSLQINRLTYSDLCVQIHESKFRQCLLKTLEALFKLMCSYYSIMSFQPEEMDFESETSNTELKQNTVSHNSEGTLVGSGAGVFSDSGVQNGFICESVVTNDKFDESSSKGITPLKSSSLHTEASAFNTMESSSDSPFYQLRKEATAFVAHALERGRRNLWQLSTSRVTVLLSCSAVCSTSTHQFLRNCEDLNIFILAGEAFCGVEAVEFRQKLKIVCENYIVTFHRQNVYALKMVLEKESWVKMSAEAPQVISLAGLTGDGAPLVVSSLGSTSAMSPSYRRNYDDSGKRKNGFAYWLKTENPFSSKLEYGLKESPKGRLSVNGSDGPILDGGMQNNRTPEQVHSPNRGYGSSSILEDENEDLLADFIDEDSQLPSRISKPRVVRSNSAHWNDEEISAQTGSSLCLLRLMDKYARLMQKLDIVNVELFKGIYQLFGIFYHYIFETFGQHDRNQNGKYLSDNLSYRLKTALSKITQDCDQWIRPQSASSLISSPLSLNSTLTQMDIMPTVPPSTLFSHVPNTSFGLKERCAATETISLVSRVLNRSKPHLQSMLSQNNSAILEDFFRNLVDSVPDLIEHINRTSARALLHINGYADKIAGAKWEVKELGLEHNGYVDLLLGEFKHYKTRLVHGGIPNEVQDLLLEYGLENIAEVLIEGLSRVKRCTDEGRVLMSLDLQVLINGLQHFVSVNVKPKLQIVETFIKAYYLPETEYVHWARAHPEYTKSQIVGLVNLVANMKGWKRKTRLEVLERIETGS
ncbi:syndetin isoform X1 [Ananas comosus]|uniref:Syndetin isoform X1 n=1 Tax=Ananas comosus TaxID=4615 RepID=A0A6P5FD16_ANACO|nr:syndetin isoform X1 [Ananas comosus]